MTKMLKQRRFASDEMDEMIVVLMVIIASRFAGPGE